MAGLLPALHPPKNFLSIIERKDGPKRKDVHLKHLRDLEIAFENTWREDRYLRAIHDDGHRKSASQRQRRLGNRRL